MPAKIQRTPFSRVFLIEDRAGPANDPSYMGLTRAMGFSWPQGDVTPVRVPDESEYGQFVVIDEILGTKGLPSLPIQSRYAQDLSELLRLVRKGCRFDVQVHMGVCRDPRDFNGGWTKVLVLEAARPTDFTTSELGALDSGEDAAVTEDVPLTGLDAYELKRLRMSELGKTEIVQEIVAVVICDSRQCGECGLPSDGCQKLFAVTVAAGGSPGMAAEVIYSPDGGTTLGETNITTLPANTNPSDAACVGIYFVVISNADDSIHYAELADILAGTETWTEVITGIVAAGSPNAIFSLGSAFTWIVGDGGYVYFSEDITSGVSVQDAGVATVQNLNDVHFVDELNGVAVGESNAVIVTTNGGSTWSAITGPAAGDGLNAVWMKSALEWLIGTATGELWYTRDGGATWTQKAFPGSGAGQVRDIQFATPTVGYMAHDTAAVAGRILRTIDGGFSWYILPEDPISFPANDKINSVAACGDDPNLVFGGGLADDALDGILLKGA